MEQTQTTTQHPGRPAPEMPRPESDAERLARQSVDALRFAGQTVPAADDSLGGRALDGLRRPGETDDVFARRLALIPPGITAKVALLDEDADAARATLAGIGARLRDAHAATTRLEREHAEAERQRDDRRRLDGRTMTDSPADRRYSDADVPVLLANLARTREDVARLTERHGEAEAHARSATAVYQGCTRWARDASPEALTAAVTQAEAIGKGVKVPSTTDGAMKLLDSTRAKIGTLEADRATVEERPVPLETAVQRLDEYLTAKGATWAADASVFLQRAVPPDHNGNGILPAVEHTNHEAFLLAMVGEKLRPLLVASLEAAAAARGPGLTDTDQRAKLREIDGDLLVLGITEELAVLKLEASGRAVTRRANAAPAAVLTVAADPVGARAA